MANDVHALFHYNFKPSKNTSQKSCLFWESFSEKQPSCISEIVGQCIWNNTYILKQGSKIFYTRLYRSGIMIINDLIDTKGNLMD